MSTKLKNIWVIDDDKLYTFLLTKTLNKLQACEKISVYENGKLGIDALKHELDQNRDLPELIFLDINMSVMDGWEFIEEYKRLANGSTLASIIYVASSSISTDDMLKARSHKEIHDYIVKPISSNTISSILEKTKKAN